MDIMEGTPNVNQIKMGSLPSIIPAEAKGEEEEARVEMGPVKECSVVNSAAASEGTSHNMHGRKRKRMRKVEKCHPKKRSRGWRPYYNQVHERDSKMVRKKSHHRKRKLRNVRRRLLKGHPLAPYNTTQFLMKEHEHDYDSSLVHDVISWQHQRNRSLSFTSMDSDDDDFYYSSPESEEEFVEQDFAQEYKNRVLERLQSLGKSELINEVMDLEGKVDHLRTQLEDAKRGEVPMSPDTAEKIMIFQKEIASLSEENKRLRELQAKLARRMMWREHQHRKIGHNSSSSSTSSSSSDSTSDSGQEDEGISSGEPLGMEASTTSDATYHCSIAHEDGPMVDYLERCGNIEGMNDEIDSSESVQEKDENVVEESKT